jgi:hypothetical protein
MEYIVSIFEEMGRALPRFKTYIRTFESTASTANMERAIIEYYTELIRQCQDLIAFLKTPPLSQLLFLHSVARANESR